MSGRTTWGSALVGSGTALEARLLSARQRAAGLLRQAVIDAERDAGGRGLASTKALNWERRQLEEAIALLCQPRPQRETQEDAARRREAERFFAEQNAETMDQTFARQP